MAAAKFDDVTKDLFDLLNKVTVTLKAIMFQFFDFVIFQCFKFSITV